LITHDLGLAARRVDRLILMEAGRFVEQGRTEDILERPKTRAAQMLASHRNWMELPC
jgi:ABC-type glutathione transport system ATPase component